MSELLPPDAKIRVPLPEDVPVAMPELPLTLMLTTAQQLKAFGDPVRVRILGIIQQQPATAKQIADLLGIPPGTAGHHLQVLEKAGLAQIVARRVVRGIVAKYYTRTARIFSFCSPAEPSERPSFAVDMLQQAHDELVESVAAFGKDAEMKGGYPRVRLAPEQVQRYMQRLEALIEDFLAEKPDPAGRVYGLVGSLFVAPPFLQGLVAQDAQSEAAGNGEEREDGRTSTD